MAETLDAAAVAAKYGGVPTDQAEQIAKKYGGKVDVDALMQQLPGSTARLRQAVGAPEPPAEPSFLDKLQGLGRDAAGQALSNVGGAITGPMAAYGKPPQGTLENVLGAMDPNLLAAKRMFGDPAAMEAQKAQEAYGQGRTSEAIGHGMAAAIPGLGPKAAEVGEQIGNQEYGKAFGNVGSMVGMAGAAGAYPDAAAAFRAAKTARTVKAPVEAWNHAVKPTDATATPKNLTIAGPYLKQAEAQLTGGGAVTNSAMPTEGLSNLIDFTKNDIGRQTAEAIAPHAEVQVAVPGYGNMAIGQAEARLQTLNAQLSKYYKGDPETQAAMQKANIKVEDLKTEADAIRNAEYDKLKQLGVTDAPKMKKVYGALRGLEDDVEKAHNRALVNSTSGSGTGLFSEVASKVGKTARGAAAAVGDNPILAKPLEGIVQLYDWQRNFGSPEYVLHRAWENYNPPPPQPFVTQGPLMGQMSRLLPPPTPQIGQTPRLAAPQPSSYPPPMGPQPVGTPNMPVHQQFLNAFETLSDKDLRKGFTNMGPTRARQLDEWLRTNNAEALYPNLSQALDRWLTDITPQTGVGRNGELLH